MTTSIDDFIGDLDGGVFAEKLSAAISEVAAAVVDNTGKGRVQVTFDFKRFGNGHQVAINHKLVSERPTMHGKVREENQTETPMHVGKRGVVTLFPEDQKQMFTKTGEVSHD